MPKSEYSNQRTIRQGEAIGHNAERTSHHVETIDLIPQPGLRAEVLIVAVQGVGEVNVLVARVDRDVVQ